MKDRTNFHRFAGMLLGLIAATGWAAPASAADCTPTEMRAADAELIRFSGDARAAAAALAAHLPWGAPAERSATSNERTLVQADYVIRYDADLRVPVWTAERVMAARLNRLVGREDCFRGDPRLDGGASALPADYREPLHDQGHMTPFANQRYSDMAGHNSFVMTNMTPQICELNRGIWQILEQIARRWAARHDSLYVLSGSVFDRDRDGRRDPDGAAQRMRSTNGRQRVAIPSAFYKIVAFQDPGGRIETLAFLLPHDRSNPTGDAALAYLRAHVTDLATLERLTGLDFFPNGRRIHEGRDLWAFDGYRPSSLCHQ